MKRFYLEFQQGDSHFAITFLADDFTAATHWFDGFCHGIRYAINEPFTKVEILSLSTGKRRNLEYREMD